MSTYTPIASVTLDSAQPSVTFSGIPQTYTDLVLVCAVKNTANNGDEVAFQLNSDTGSNYSRTRIFGNGSTAQSGRASNTTKGALGINSTAQFSTIIANFQNYSNATTYKTVVSRGSDASNYVSAYVSLWRNTNAITSIVLLPDSGTTFTSGSTFNLYGVANASITNTAKATGGDSITTDGTYWYHTFYSSGTFTPTEALTADYLVVAGGGGGGAYDGGGGGGGGLRSTVTATGGGGSLESALSLALNTSYTVTVGAGGAGTVGTGLPTEGINSSISGTGITTITSTGGGRGGGYNGNPNFYAATTGGSGGGGAYGTFTSGAAGTANQGYAGGNGDGSVGAGGGGGAGAVGGNSGGSGTPGGAGGAGVAVSITGSSVTYAGGGGGATYPGGGGTTGGAGGAGGGGAGGANSVGTNGTANTGGGGGGAQDTAAPPTKASGNGGSGIVIVRYAV